jgi:hypothetical protein
MARQGFLKIFKIPRANARIVARFSRRFSMVPIEVRAARGTAHGSENRGHQW